MSRPPWLLGAPSISGCVVKPPRTFRRLSAPPPPTAEPLRSNSGTFELPKAFGMPGMSHQLLVRPGYPHGDPRNDAPVQGSPGRYGVTFTFARPGRAPTQDDALRFEADVPGDSHLAIAAPALNRPLSTGREIKVAMTTDFGTDEFVGHANEQGFLATLTGRVDARTFAAAEIRARATITPFVSSLSAQLDVPLWIWRVLIVEEDTQARAMSMTSPWPVATIGDASVNTVSPEFRVFAGLYREALTSSSEVYAFLCFYKIAEAIRHRRSQGPATRHPNEKVPADASACTAWLLDIYPRGRQWDDLGVDSLLLPEAVGRRFGDLLDSELNTLRDDIAHVLSKVGVLRMSVDDSLHLLRVHKWLALLRVMVRRMLRNEFPSDFLSSETVDDAG